MAATTRTVDLTNVREASEFNPRRMPEGDYLARIVNVDDHKGKKSGEDGWVFTVQLEDNKRVTYPMYCMLADNQLWKVRNLFVAAGIAVPKKRLKIDPNKLLNKLIGVTLEDDEYEGRQKSVIQGVFPKSELDETADADTDDVDDDEVEDEVPAAKPARKKAKPAPVEDDDEDEDDDEPEPVKPARKSRAKKVVEPEPDEDDEEDEEDEPAPPARKGKKATTPAKAKAKAKVVEEDDEDEDDDDLDLDEL